MLNNLQAGINTSIFDKEQISDNFYQVNLLKQEKGNSLLTQIKMYLDNCDEFYIAVAFITTTGVQTLISSLIELEKKNVQGTIITSNYLNFTEPEAIRRLQQFKNITVKMNTNSNMHAKGFFFKKGNIYHTLIGSTNLTRSALLKNNEWMLKVSSLQDGKLVEQVISTFNELNDSSENIDKKFLYEYEEIYKQIKEYNKSLKKFEDKNLTNTKQYIPNKMQTEALENIHNLIDDGEKKAILISATGTGKTMLSAFMVKEQKPKRVLFIAHRQNILEKSIETFKEVLNNDKTYGLVGGGNKPTDKDYTFAMITTLTKDDVLYQIPKDYYDIIIVDEVHHAQAKSYLKVINYCTPKFMLGMTATPERTDGQNIYELFDYNIAYEIRLHDALEEDLLVPFHYYGIEDTELQVPSMDNKVKHIIEQSDKYGYYGSERKALLFVSTVNEAIDMALTLNDNNINTVALSGDDSEEVRSNTIKKLENGEIEIIVTVDIFNEGIDIPKVNQIILFRPTESAIVYTQQIGRGLRKAENKKYVVILDFIGNYEKNYLITTALSGDRSMDKQYYSTFTRHATDMIPGVSTIDFTRIAQERILQNIEKTNFSQLKIIKESYLRLKNEIGRIPYFIDFVKYNEVSPEVIKGNKKTCYDMHLKFETELQLLNKTEHIILEFLTKYFTPIKRVHEHEILKYFIDNDSATLEQLQNYIESKYNYNDQQESTLNALNHLSLNLWFSFSEYKKYIPLLELKDNKYKRTTNFNNALQNANFKKYVEDIIKYNEDYLTKNKTCEDSIVLYQNYSKVEAYKYFNMEYNNGYQVGGYSPELNNKVLIFATIAGDTSFTSYDNYLVDNIQFKWYSKNNRKLSNNNGETLEGKIAKNKVDSHVFLRKSSNDDFIYIGKVDRVEQFEEKNCLVEYLFTMTQRLPDDVYNKLS